MAQQRDQTSMGLLTEPGRGSAANPHLQSDFGPGYKRKAVLKNVNENADNSALLQGKSLWKRCKYVRITV
jgi:hypothetical protein